MTKEKAKLKDLKLKFTSFQDSYEELKTSHENLKETHEKLEEAHNTLLNHERKATLSIGVSCDLIMKEKQRLSPHSRHIATPNNSRVFFEVSVMLL